MSELRDTGFTRPTVQMPKHFMEDVGMHAQTAKFIREMKAVRAQKKFLKEAATARRHSFVKLIRRPDTAEERISEPEDG